MLLKLDLKKAFDHIEWSFVRQALHYFNFPSELIKLIRSCITTTSISILVNGTPTPFFNPSRGIRQGDPLSHIYSSYAWNYSPVILTGLLTIHSGNQYNSQEMARPYAISHLLFADDIILTATVSAKSFHAIIDFLNDFNNASSQKINFDKSKIFFSKNCTQSDKNFVLSSFNMREGTIFGKYLVFPIFTKRRSKQDFQFLIGNFKSRLAGWKTSFLTMAGRTQFN